ncbi:UNVERIFIED_CONTAM: Kinase-interacting protein 1 [Sesamum angustifolium]|uniref:Kinase-interacting protein 1 n=1 Tax=Sesamum angustifolium TaxID=2727405 RepID=A0AAW2RNB1_9LAMI
MEEKVQNMLKLIEEDGDSFAKRAEMYYKRRPEIINSVEESYRAFKALADRYDMLSKELQNANHTIATVFPEQVQFAMDEDEYCPTPKMPKSSQIPLGNTPNVPKVPKAPMENLKGLLSTATKPFQVKKSSKGQKKKKKAGIKSGMSREEALVEIEKLHKETLTLQTVKEFVKSSYESGLAKYWEIENQIMEMQDKVCRMQDEFDVEIVIEDNEARTLMAEAALKSCQETLTTLEEKQEQSTRDAEEEFKKIESARELLKSLRRECIREETDEQKMSKDDKAAGESKCALKDVSDLVELSTEIDPLDENSITPLDLSSMESMTVTELAEKIDELVNKVISLETAVSSQTVLINSLRMEADDLHAQIKNLENEKESLINKHNLSTRVKEMEEKLNRLEALNKNVERQNSNLQSNFAEARSSLGQLSEKLSNVKPDEDGDDSDSSQNEAKPSSSGNKLQEKIKDQKVSAGKSSSSGHKSREEIKDQKVSVGKSSSTEHKLQEEIKDQKVSVGKTSSNEHKLQEEIKAKKVPVLNPGISGKLIRASKTDENEDVKEVDENVQSSEPSVSKQEEAQIPSKKSVTFSDESVKDEALEEMDDREKVLLKEYTTILRNYKDVKKRLNDVEKRERDSQFDMTVQMRELKEAILKRDQEIQQLRQKLNQMHSNKDATEEKGIPPDSSEDRSVKPESESVDVEVEVEDVSAPSTIERVDVIKFVFVDKPPTISPVEEKLRLAIDAILDENLDFWFRNSRVKFRIYRMKHQKLKEKKKLEGNASTQIKSEARPIYKHFREIQTELTVWLDQSATLKDELKSRSASLCSIQEDITRALKEGVEEEEIQFNSHQAAKLQGEVLNMKQENNKVREELQTGLDHISILQLDIEKTLKQLNEDFGITSDQPQLQHTMSKSRVPLRAFIFGGKPKKQKSIFSFMHPNRKFQVVRPGFALTN